MVVSRLIGKIALSGTVRKQVSREIYREYSHAVRQLENSGALNGVKAELKLKAKNSFLGKGADYVQLAYKDSKGKIQKLALDKRNADVSARDYLEAAIQKAKTITGDGIKTRMPKSKNYEQFTQALKNNQNLSGNLPENATVTFKRGRFTGHKKAVVSVPVIDEKGATTYLTQTLKKGRGKDMGEFVQEATEHANLVFENTINPKGLLSGRQIQEEARQVRLRNAHNAGEDFNKDWSQAFGEVRQYLSETPKSDAVVDKAMALTQEALNRAEKRIERKHEFKYANFENVNNKFEKLRSQLATSPSRNKSKISLAEEYQKTFDNYMLEKNELEKRYTQLFSTEFKEYSLKFEQAKRHNRLMAEVRERDVFNNTNNSSGLFTRLYNNLPSMGKAKELFNDLVGG